jgi:hypothetical protein
LITADAGGSNSYRYRLWKAELAALAAETGLTITVCHFPPGTSKWNKIEHRLFSQITMNWRGRPLTSHQVVVATIASTRTQTGLRVEAALDTGSYPLGVAVPIGELRRLPITAHAERGAWNYTIAPTSASGIGPVRADERARTRAEALAVLADERLTGMTAAELTDLAAQLAPAQAAQAAQRRFEQRGGARRRRCGQHRAAHRCRSGVGHRRLSAPALLDERALGPARHQAELDRGGHRRHPGPAGRARPHDRGEHPALRHGRVAH